MTAVPKIGTVPGDAYGYDIYADLIDASEAGTLPAYDPARGGFFLYAAETPFTLAALNAQALYGSGNGYEPNYPPGRYVLEWYGPADNTAGPTKLPKGLTRANPLSPAPVAAAPEAETPPA